MPWLADNILVVLFLPHGGAFPDAQQTYVTLAGREPDAFQRHAAGGPMGPSTAQGAFGDGTLIVSVQPGRMDFTFAGPIQSTGIPDEVKDVEPTIRRAVEAISPLLERTPVNRLSVVLNLMMPARTEREAADLVRGMVHLDTLPETVSDLLLQINSRRHFSSLPEQQMNRLMRWGTARQQVFNVPLSNVGASSPFIVSDQYVANCTVDVNSMPSASPFSPAVATAIFTELAQTAASLLHGGYEALVGQ